MEIQAELKLVTTDKISGIKDNSNETMDRIRIVLKNKYELSVISGEHAYCTLGKSFEIAIYDKDGNFCPDLFDDEDKGDVVLGHCSYEKVKSYIEKVGAI